MAVDARGQLPSSSNRLELCQNGGCTRRKCGHFDIYDAAEIGIQPETKIVFSYLPLPDFNLFSKSTLYWQSTNEPKTTPHEDCTVPLYVRVSHAGDWDGVIFVHSGVYEGGVFRFRMIIPHNYPTQAPPRLFFQSPIFHPQIDQDSGELSLRKHYPKWNPQMDRLWHVLKYVRYIFYNISSKNAVNTAAATLHDLEDKTKFHAAVEKSIADAHVDIDGNAPSTSSIQFDVELPTNPKRAIEAMLEWGRTNGKDYARQPAKKHFEAAAARDTLLKHKLTWAHKDADRGNADQISPGAHPLARSLRDVLKAREGSRADCADVRLTEARCSGWLMTPDVHANMQRRWAVLTYPPGAALVRATASGTPLSPRTPESQRTTPATPQGPVGDGGSAPYSVAVAMFDNEKELTQVDSFSCEHLCRAYQPNTAEMRSNNKFMVVLPDRVIHMQAPSNNAVRVWLSALCL